MRQMHDWSAINADLDARGWATLPGLLNASQCKSVVSLYENDAHFRSHILMARHGFGKGEYKYFAYPLPPLVQEVRTSLYPRLADVANRWHEVLGVEARFPSELAEYLEECHKAGQQRPTPLLLRYGPGDYNCLHQDVYGEHLFPLQLTVLLSKPGEDQDFEGGEFVLVEQRPRMQSRPMVVPLQQGDAVIFAVNRRPAKGNRGAYRVSMRHGVSELRRGQRHTLGVIFHDAT